MSTIGLTFLGTGTSHGVPVIGCDCDVCRSTDPKNKRTRCSALVESDGHRILIDTSPELRLQVIREGIDRIDAVVYTHAHVDHLFGLDDCRRFNEITGLPLPVYGSASTLDIVRRVFDYAFMPGVQVGGGLPVLELHEISGPFQAAGIEITPVPIRHGRLHILGFRIGDLAYLTDCSSIPDDSIPLLEGLDLLVLGVLRPHPHPTHLSLSEGLDVVGKLRPKRALFTHISHRLDHNETNRLLPTGVELAYDGMRVTMGIHA
jgi:phosphoribosyl 1,2-cyclic phosphate phosphodiesterase